ncbi:MAG: transcription antitermination factor NusB [Spirochaetes bacterium]|nr:MAG: transcription antitermination factor NusB [Spirochaetota bacterium]
MGSRHKGRIIAFQAIYSWSMNKNPLTEIIRFDWLKGAYRKVDEETLYFARLLVTGTLENLIEIDSLVKKQLENWDFSRLSRVDLAILRMSVFSLLYQKEIPPSVTIDEAINIAREFGGDDSYRFVNGVLDGIKKVVQTEFQ